MNPLQSVPRLLFLMIGVLFASWMATATALYIQDVAAERSARKLNEFHLPIMKASGYLSREIQQLSAVIDSYQDELAHSLDPDDVDAHLDEAVEEVRRGKSVIDQNMITILSVSKGQEDGSLTAATRRLEVAWGAFDVAQRKSLDAPVVWADGLGKALDIFYIRSVQFETLHIDPQEQLLLRSIDQQGRARVLILLGLVTLVLVGSIVSIRVSRRIVTSIRDHDQMLSQLAERERGLAEAQHIAQVGSWSWDFTSGTVEWSDEAYRIFGLVPQSVPVSIELFMEKIHADDRELVSAAIQESRTGDGDYAVEHRVVGEDGLERWVSESGVVSFDGDGNPLSMRGTMQDITARKAADEEIRILNRNLETKVHARTAELQLQKEFSEMILNAAGEGVYGIGLHGNCTFINPAACEMLGGSPSVFLGNNAHDMLHHTHADGEPYPVEQCHIYRAFQEGKATTVSDEVFWRIDGSSFPVEYTSTPIIVDDQIMGAVVVFRDTTDARDMQAQLIHSSKLATLGEMATGVAHELNQPMNVIRLAAGNVLKRQQKDMLEPGYMIQKLERIMGQTQRASDIIDHMRIFGRKTENEPHPVSLKESVINALSLVGEQMRLAEVKIDLDLPEEDIIVRGHSVQVEQVCLNLLTNARDILMVDGGPRDKRVSISATLNEDEGIVLMRIRDSGGGIDESVMDRIFEPFFTTKEVGKGTGLGLSISYGIITEMKGNISAANTDTGAEFTITLPVIDAADARKLAV